MKNNKVEFHHCNGQKVKLYMPCLGLNEYEVTQGWWAVDGSLQLSLRPLDNDKEKVNEQFERQTSFGFGI